MRLEGNNYGTESSEEAQKIIWESQLRGTRLMSLLGCVDRDADRDIVAAVSIKLGPIYRDCPLRIPT